MILSVLHKTVRKQDPHFVTMNIYLIFKIYLNLYRTNNTKLGENLEVKIILT